MSCETNLGIKIRKVIGFIAGSKEKLFCEIFVSVYAY